MLERKEAAPNAAYRGVIQIMHGCDGRPTTRVSVTIPEGVTGAKPMPKPGWTISTVKSAYARAYPSFHGQVSECADGLAALVHGRDRRALTRQPDRHRPGAAEGGPDGMF